MCHKRRASGLYCVLKAQPTTPAFLNGQFAGSHDGASTPFNVDITGLVTEENRIVVTVDVRRSPFRIPMDNSDWFYYGGIYRDVLLYRLPPVYIKDWFVRLAKDGGIEADVFVAAADGGNAAGTVYLAIPELGVQAEQIIQNNNVSFYNEPPRPEG